MTFMDYLLLFGELVATMFRVMRPDERGNE
jgi:hypothetical protein